MMIENTTINTNQPPVSQPNSQIPPSPLPKTLWLFIGLAVIVALAAGFAVYWTKFLKQPQSQNQQPAKDINQILDEATSLPQINIPSGNPLEKIAPEKNPIELTNPFNNAYQNPFE